MIEHNGKKYYSIMELIDFINDEDTELHSVWKRYFPKYKNVVLLDQVSRILGAAKKAKKIDFLEYTKHPETFRKYYAYTILDVINYITKEYGSVFNVKLNNKGENV